MTLRAVVVIVLLLSTLFARLAFADDIPDNCETGSTPHIFARYEPQNARLVLVDWTTGADVSVVEGNLADTRILGWSVDCRYLAGAVGSYDSMDTVVWDVTTSTRVGSVPDARQQPHRITWGPSGYLVVETRGGAILWNVPANTQVVLTTSFDSYSARNFNRLRWDADNLQLIANLAVGGREVYDLTTGAQVEVAAGAVDVGDRQATAIGGNQFVCGGWYFGVRLDDNRYIGAYPVYDVSSQQIILTTNTSLTGIRREIIQVIESNLVAPWVQMREMTQNCRYLFASVGRFGEDASDTVAWDIVENRRVGVVPDARVIEHPILYGDNSVLITTRQGGYLWYLPTNTLIQLTPNVETALAGNRSITSFLDADWDFSRNQVITVVVGEENKAQVFDALTGQLVGSYDLTRAPSNLSIEISSTGRFLRVESQLIDRETNFELAKGSVQFSRDGRWAVVTQDDQTLIWDAEQMLAGGVPNKTYARRGQLITYENVAILSLNEQRIDLPTGQILSVTDVTNVTTLAPIDGQSGMTDYSTDFITPGRATYTCTQSVYPVVWSGDLLLQGADGSTLRVLETDIEVRSNLLASPDCRYVAAWVFDRSREAYDDAPLEGTLAAYDYGELVIWEMATGERVTVIPHYDRRYSYPTILWSPDGQFAFLRTTAGHFIWNSQSMTATILTSEFDTSYTSYYSRAYAIPNRRFQLYWDFERGQILIGTYRGIGVFDILTGQLRYHITAGNYWDRYAPEFAISENGNRIIFERNERDVVWDLDRLVEVSESAL
jgi:hypothetical protein